MLTNAPLLITVNETDMWTKRKVLSDAAKIFDYLGWLAPTVIISKFFLKKLRSQHESWDERLPDSLARQRRRKTSSTYKNQDSILYSYSTDYRHTSARIP
ncbi:hypothetical protein TNIN_134961 [Trichonephila inaurata madagascariensis]|uniref:Uncharacterized protein n=1 Tax=Trichonephila inaurata madagascariensis TaxID=2747483 RepID=A0A8X7CDN6_9ARAC|nr:hypothetical protein TNIN_134961 [Trichonephila inaurata madagascariensis]